MSAFRLRPRHLLSASFAIAMIAIACGSGDDEITAPVATAAPAPASTLAPTAAPEPTSTPAPPEPTATTAPAPTATTAPEVSGPPTPTPAPTATSVPPTQAPAPTSTPAPPTPPTATAPTATASPEPTATTVPSLPEGVQSVTITASKDNTLYENPTGALSNGSGTGFFAGRTGSGAIRRGLVAFDIAGAIPADAIVTRVSLQLQMTRGVAAAAEVELRRALSDWGEGASDAEANEGAGTQAASGDATWLHTHYDSKLWQNSGGDFAANPSAVTTVEGEGFYTWESTDQLILDVEKAHRNPEESFGWVILGDESKSSTAKRFGSTQSQSADSRPQLTIEYTLPVPPTPTATPEPTPTPESQSFSVIAFKDNTLYESGAGTLSNGSGTSLFAGKTGGGFTRRALIAFDVAGSIPAGSRITSATLEMRMTRTIAGDTDVSIHRVQTEWGEGTSDASGNEGGGAGSTDGDATWLHSRFDSSLWGNSGGDFSAQPSGVTSVGSVGKYTWESTDQMVIDVQRWLDDPSENFGWILLGDETRGSTAKRFASTQISDTGSRPLLKVGFTQAK